MGRIKTKMIKRITKQLGREHGARFTGSFQDNKAALMAVADVRSKKLRNVLAGSLAHQAKLKKDVQDYTD